MVIKGPVFADYMGVPGIEAEHVTLVLENASPRTEVQLLRYLNPDMLPDPHIRDLNKLGLNHVCFAVDDIRQRWRGCAARAQDAQRDHGFSRAKAGVCRGARRRDDRTVTVARGLTVGLLPQVVPMGLGAVANAPHRAPAPVGALAVVEEQPAAFRIRHIAAHARVDCRPAGPPPTIAPVPATGWPMVRARRCPSRQHARTGAPAPPSARRSARRGRCRPVRALTRWRRSSGRSSRAGRSRR